MEIGMGNKGIATRKFVLLFLGIATAIGLFIVFVYGVVYGKNMWDVLGLVTEGEEFDGVQLFDDEGYGGSDFKLTNNINYLENFNEKASSIKIPDGWEVELYENSGFGGKKIRIAGDSNYLGRCKEWWEFGAGCIHYISSIKFDTAPCGAHLYQNENFEGDVYYAVDDIPKLTDIQGCDGNWNDCVESIKVDAECKATLYDNEGYGGHFMVVSGESSSIVFNDKTSSVKVFKAAQ